MTGNALFDFLIAIVGLCIMVGLFFLAIDRIAQDDFFKKVARYAVGGAALIVFLLAVKGVLFGGGGGLAVTPVGVIEFAIGLIVVVVVLAIIYFGIDRFGAAIASAEVIGIVKMVIAALALIAILVLASRVLFGGGAGFIGSLTRHSELYHPQIDYMVPCPTCPAHQQM